MTEPIRFTELPDGGDAAGDDIVAVVRGAISNQATLGTAAGKDTGTANGQIPEIANGNLPDAVIPDTYNAAATAAAVITAQGTADGAQSVAGTALTNAATADGKAVAAQATADGNVSATAITDISTTAAPTGAAVATALAGIDSPLRQAQDFANYDIEVPPGQTHLSNLFTLNSDLQEWRTRFSQQLYLSVYARASVSTGGAVALTTQVQSNLNVDIGEPNVVGLSSDGTEQVISFEVVIPDNVDSLRLEFTRSGSGTAEINAIHLTAHPFGGVVDDSDNITSSRITSPSSRAAAAADAATAAAAQAAADDKVDNSDTLNRTIANKSPSNRLTEIALRDEYRFSTDLNNTRKQADLYPGLADNAAFWLQHLGWSFPTNGNSQAALGYDFGRIGFLPKPVLTLYDEENGWLHQFAQGATAPVYRSFPNTSQNTSPSTIPFVEIPNPIASYIGLPDTSNPAPNEPTIAVAQDLTGGSTAQEFQLLFSANNQTTWRRMIRANSITGLLDQAANTGRRDEAVSTKDIFDIYGQLNNLINAAGSANPQQPLNDSIAFVDELLQVRTDETGAAITPPPTLQLVPPATHSIPATDLTIAADGITAVRPLDLRLRLTGRMEITDYGRTQEGSVVPPHSGDMRLVVSGIDTFNDRTIVISDTFLEIPRLPEDSQEFDIQFDVPVLAGERLIFQVAASGDSGGLDDVLATGAYVRGGSLSLVSYSEHLAYAAHVASRPLQLITTPHALPAYRGFTPLVLAQPYHKTDRRYLLLTFGWQASIDYGTFAADLSRVGSHPSNSLDTITATQKGHTPNSLNYTPLVFSVGNRGAEINHGFDFYSATTQGRVFTMIPLVSPNDSDLITGFAIYNVQGANTENMQISSLAAI